MKRSRGFRSKTRKKLRIKRREVFPITRALQEFEIGEKVCIDIDPSFHKGMPHPRFQGYTGEIEGKQGNAYKVGIRDGGKHKVLIVLPEHLKRVV
ncbi:MAG: 50S ribosomal protein L21e [Thermoplasmata archaeon]|nr:50S ribosomal protein L21e [Thermoplasmata archaeon]RLF35583.1 MAG: 50S ribosomal protein L21e [Thermoplasmata archaeon]RLF39503.1 MAG: 50S ribosomal protein L21e [Thermoplasmata archaeon]